MENKDKIFKSFIENARKSRGLKLVGKCNNCGRCCNPVTSYSTNLEKNTMDVIDIANTPCIHLDLETKKCNNYEKRCTLCSMFPYLPENLFEGCGFHFEKIEKQELKLSAVLICKNEESCIEKCLKSLVGIDEIIILDTGSTDKTCEIARNYTDKVFENEYKWNDNFAEARNLALSKASGDWVLSIDCDEVLMENGVDRIKKAIDVAENNNQKTINIIMVANIEGSEFFFPRLFKKCEEVYWCGAIHNYLNVSDNNKSDIKITYGYSKAHENDPDRALRILKKEVEKNPELVREVFYLAREYWYRKDYITAIYWYKDYLTRAFWPPEWSEAWLMLARCYWAINKNDEAKDACLQAIKINADFAEALEFMAELCGPNNKAKWTEYANLANSNNVLTLRKKVEKCSDYYDNLFSSDSNMLRYYQLYDKIGKMVGEEKVLDIGCGCGFLQKFVQNYSGFDFSPKAVEISNNKNVWQGDAYNKKNYKGNYDTFVSTETFEHLDDLKILQNIESGKRVLFSVPSFSDVAHLRTYSDKLVYLRYKDVLKIKNIIRFNWKNNGWFEGGELTGSYILLVDSIKL